MKGPHPRATTGFFTKGIALLLGVIILVSSVLVTLVATHESRDDKGDDEGFEEKETYELDPASLAFSGASAYGFVKSQTNLGPRPVMSENHSRTVDFIYNSLNGFGLETEIVPFSESFDGKEYDFKNVVARKNGTYEFQEGANDSVKDVIIFGAHFDTRDIADWDPNTANRSKPIPGANDGGSGVGVLLELARIFSKMSLAPTLEFVFFDGEDFEIEGTNPPLAGSTHHAQTLDPEFKKRIHAVVVVDMVGDRKLEIKREGHSTDGIGDIIFAQADSLGYKEFQDVRSVNIIDDHLPFIQRNIPAIDIIDFTYPTYGTNYWHTQEDSFDKISEESLAKVGKVLELFVYNLSAKLRGEEMLEEPYGINEEEFGNWALQDGIMDMSTSRSDKPLPTAPTTLEYGSLNITGSGTLNNTMFHIHHQLNIGHADGGRGGNKVPILRNCSFVSGSVEHDFYVNISSGVLLDNCSLIFNNKVRGISIAAGNRQNSIDMKGKNIILKNILIHNSPGFAAFLKVENLSLTGGLVTGSGTGGLGFINSTATLSSFRAEHNNEFAVRARARSNLTITDSRFLDTQLGEACSSCGPPPTAPAVEAQNSELTIVSSLFKENHVGVELLDARADIQQSRFVGNEKSIDSSESELLLMGNTLSGNKNGVVSELSTLTAENNDFRNHSRAITLFSSSGDTTPLITNNRFFSNTYGINLWSSTGEIRENNFTDSEYGISLNSPKNVTIAHNELWRNRNGTYASSLFKQDYPYLLNITGNSFHETLDKGITFLGALDPQLTSNTFHSRPPGARDVVQQWQLEILVLNESVGTTIEITQNGTLVEKFTLKSGENFRALIVDEHWTVDDARNETSSYTITVTKPAVGGGGEPEIKTELVTVDTHVELVVEF